MAKRGEARAFFEAAKAYEGDDCLLWPFTGNDRGYGQLKEDGRMVYVHRRMCEHAHGAAPTPDHEAAHSCGKRGCLNKRHLRWDTHLGNHADRIDHGTSNRGEANGIAKLTEQTVHEIRAALAQGERRRSIADRYGLTVSAISHVAKGSTWAWLISPSTSASSGASTP